MMGKYVPVVAVLLLFTVVQASAEGGKVCIFFFYGVGCPDCSKVELHINLLKQKYPSLDVHRFEIYNNRSNLQLLNGYFEKYGVPQNQRTIPAIFISNSYLIDETDISEHLEEKISNLLGTGCQCPSLEEEAKDLTPLSLLAITGAALADSINPCAFAVLIFLLSLLSASNEKRRLIRSSVAFMASIYVAYLLFGIGLFSTLQITGLSYWFYKLVGSLAIIIGLFNVKDYFWYGRLGFAMEVPQRLKPKLTNLLETATNPLGAFMVGFAVCLLELPCTGGPYLYVLGLMAEKTTRLSAIPLLLYYNLIFILPQILITLLVYLGLLSIPKVAHWKLKSTKPLHLVMGLAMITLGTIMILELA